ncbi:spermidine synthase [Pseudothermotoga lettingae TMO]|uniref:Polyamine aminopropyltransferase n=2 Tax=Thermotogaceae TaxID=188709 RepID=A8F586_PSELT|nr:spermidine synthase [Pseudothermotoga lettingae TMO]KUK21329.1 MAG: Spermidine synthase [Pseudothermotoga lettingae]MDI3493966.1 spermidine synthase [Pseudothermotoga sp.]MDK2884508.1 spermidine synthase [Pseudothermotoga sp.]GLI49763.1 polyamine aminopropyltransferase [Pseudothermotoga lettingae TMO]
MPEKMIPGKHLWFFDYFPGGDVGLFMRISNMVHSQQTRYQRIDIFDNPTLGRVFALDGITMTTDADEFMYHEMLAHVPMFSHPNPVSVLIVGGGDGGTLREVLRHPGVKRAVLCEIDEQVVEAARQYLKTSESFDDKRAEFAYENGADYVKRFKNEFDVIIIDSTDPTAGEGGHLFTQEFYKSCFDALREDGILTVQAENALYDFGWTKITHRRISSVFPIVKAYQGFVPTYPSGYWLYIFASKNIDPVENFRYDDAKNMSQKLKYYNEELHKACFVLPNFIKNELKGKM